MKVFTWQHRFLVLTLTLSVVLVFGFLGWLIGRSLGSAQAGIVVAVLLSYPLSLWLVASRLRKRALANAAAEETTEA